MVHLEEVKERHLILGAQDLLLVPEEEVPGDADVKEVRMPLAKSDQLQSFPAGISATEEALGDPALPKAAYNLSEDMDKILANFKNVWDPKVEHSELIRFKKSSDI